MSTVRYENEDAIFYFDLQDVEPILKHLLSEPNVCQAAKLLETISSHHADHPGHIRLFPVYHSGSL